MRRSCNFGKPGDRRKLDDATGTKSMSNVASSDDRKNDGRTMGVALVIEDEPELAGFVVGAFRHLSFEAVAVESAERAIELIDRTGRVVVAFVNLSAQDQRQALVTTIAARWPHVKMIVLSSQPEDMRRIPPVLFITKPTSGAILMAVLKRLALDTGKSRGFLH